MCLAGILDQTRQKALAAARAAAATGDAQAAAAARSEADVVEARVMAAFKAMGEPTHSTAIARQALQFLLRHSSRRRQEEEA